MGSKYTSNSIAGYNATPPSDDGSQTEANKVKWSTIKTKITDPIKTLAESINSGVNTALDYGPVSLDSAALTLGSSHNNQLIEMTGAATPTLNSADGLGAGWFCDVKNIGSSAITMARAKSGDTINNVTADVTMNPLDYIRFVVNAAATGFIVAPGVQIATQAQVDAGEASDVFLTPKTHRSAAAPTVSGYTGAYLHYMHNDGADVTALDVDSTVSAGTWQTVGPTGAGAEHTWTALDDLPSTATGVLLQANSIVTGNADATIYGLYIYVKDGDEASATEDVRYRRHSNVMKNSSAVSYGHPDESQFLVPVNSSQVFKIFYNNSPFATLTAESADLRLIGWLE